MVTYLDSLSKQRVNMPLLTREKEDSKVVYMMNIFDWNCNENTKPFYKIIFQLGIEIKSVKQHLPIARNVYLLITQ